jgi:hypothetical protein
MKLWRLPKTEASNLKYRVPSLWPPYLGERRTTFAKAYGIKVRCYGELPPPPAEKEKKQGTLSACLGLPIGYMKFLFPKEFVTILKN